MEEKLIDLLSRFGYETQKIAGKYHIFDRRLCRRIEEYRSVEELYEYCNVMSFSFLEETLDRTVTAFREMLCPSPVTKPEPVTVAAEPEQDPEQEETVPPADPDDGMFEKICPTCGKTFRTARKQVRYCCPDHYPSEVAKRSKNGSEVV